MTKPYIICHMMTTIDGRIDCEMVAKLTGTEEYYATLTELSASATVSGRVTAQLELSQPDIFTAQNEEAYAQEGFSKKIVAAAYEVVVDTKGTLLWQNQSDSEKPLVVITSQQVTKEYLAYLDSLQISWIVCGKEKIDLVKSMKILATEFGVERVAVVGGGAINASFLAAGLLDEVSILLAPGIDGRKGMTAAFDGLSLDVEPFNLQLKNVKTYENGAIWLRYLVKK